MLLDCAFLPLETSSAVLIAFSHVTPVRVKLTADWKCSLKVHILLAAIGCFLS